MIFDYPDQLGGNRRIRRAFPKRLQQDVALGMNRCGTAAFHQGFVVFRIRQKVG